MKRGEDDQEWVLYTCPKLVSLRFFIVCVENEEDKDDDGHVGIIRSITLELPSLEKLWIENADAIKKCTLTCPKLVDIEFMGCRRMAALNFDGGAQSRRLESESRLSSSCIVHHKKVI